MCALSPQGLPHIFAGSLALFDINGPVDVAVDLAATDFAGFTVPTATNPGQPPLQAGYRTTVAGAGIGEFWAGSIPSGGPVRAAR